VTSGITSISEVIFLLVIVFVEVFLFLKVQEWRKNHKNGDLKRRNE